MAVSIAKPPAPLDPVPFNIADPIRYSLVNGMRVVVLPSERVPLVAKAGKRTTAQRNRAASSAINSARVKADRSDWRACASFIRIDAFGLIPLAILEPTPDGPLRSIAKKP